MEKDVDVVLDALDKVEKRIELKTDARFRALERDLLEVEKKAGRLRLGGAETSANDSGLTPEQADHQKAFQRYLRRGEVDGLADLARKAMNTSSDPDGGYLVPVEMDRMIDRVAETVSPMHRIAHVVTIGTAKFEKLVKTAGMAMRRVAEGSTGGETTEPRYSKVSIEVHTAEVEPWVHNETLEDSRVNLEEDLAMEAATAFAEGAGSEFITGNGVGSSRGLLSYPIVANSAYAWGSIGYIVSGLSAGFVATTSTVNAADCLVNLQHALRQKYRTGASWLMNSATAGVVRKLRDKDGRWIWSDAITQGQPATLLGNGVEIDDNMPDIGAGSLSIAFGNFKRAYTIVNRTGTSLIRDNVTQKGVTKLNFRRRFAGGVTHYEAIKLLKFATS
jgi:HK97 family phage major capsid protein